MDWKAIVWGQFGAAVDMLEDAIRACPDGLWSDPDSTPQIPSHAVIGFWYEAFHAAYWVHVYLADHPGAFVPPQGFVRDDQASGFLPERPYTREAVLALVAQGRDAYRSALAATTEAQAEAPCGFPWLNGLSRAELYLYSLRHVQHHAAKLNLLLREATGATPGWVARSRTPLEGA